MLSRVADALFWMSRYLERAEHVARLLDVGFHNELEIYGLATGAGDEIDDVLTILQSQPGPAARSPHDWLTFDPANPNSIVSCIGKARNNARCIRGNLSTEVWRELNKLYWRLRDPDFGVHAQDSPHEFYGAVQLGSHLIQGVCHATLVHDEGWQFLQLGMCLERAEKTLRILDVKHRQLQKIDLPLAHLRWAGVLRSCLAYEAYQRLYIGRVEPHRVVGFLLLHEQFPRSVRFSLECAAHALEALEGRPLERGDAPADRILGRVLAMLRFPDLNALLTDRLHGHLQAVLRSCEQVSAAIQEHYALG